MTTNVFKIRRRFWILGILIFIFLIHDIIITHILAFKICRSDPHPKTFINKTVEYPESIYWEDNIYPGYNEKDRLLMIRHYLDGVHLKTMALNGPDGAIYLYTATRDDWQGSRDIKTLKREGNYYDQLDIEAKKIADRGSTYTPETMPQLNYKVVFNSVVLNSFQRRYLWSDEVKIIESKSKELIAYNRRLMRKYYMIMPDLVGRRFYFSEPMCGRSGFTKFDHLVFVFYQNVPSHPAHMGINSKLHQKFKK